MRLMGTDSHAIEIGDSGQASTIDSLYISADFEEIGVAVAASRAIQFFDTTVNGATVIDIRSWDKHANNTLTGPIIECTGTNVFTGGIIILGANSGADELFGSCGATNVVFHGLRPPEVLTASDDLDNVPPGVYLTFSGDNASNTPFDGNWTVEVLPRNQDGGSNSIQTAYRHSSSAQFIEQYFRTASGSGFSPWHALTALRAAPATASTNCSTGQVAVDTDFFYICRDTNTWERAAIDTW